MTTGTASTLTSAAEALEMTLPGAASIPAADSNQIRVAAASGRRILEMIWEVLKPGDVLDRRALKNAITMITALGGSSNSAIHLTAVDRPAGVDINLESSDKLSRTTPVIANIRPSGRWLMEDVFLCGRPAGVALPTIRQTTSRCGNGQRAHARGKYFRRQGLQR